ncbi:MAG: FAD-binding and (Fe-S)-binding domain-containing protein [Rhodothermaceae bacterium]
MNFEELKKEFSGEIITNDAYRTLYSTDASVYKEKPLAVTKPKTVNDIKKLISFARENKTSIIPRTAGTSLAGQVVGGGIIADVSAHWTKIIEVNKKEKWVRVQPGVVLDELNKYLAPMELFFGPETSTSNRCMIGGMVGNNSCGSHSLIYGSTRDHLLEVKAVLSDGSEAVFSDLTKEEFKQKLSGDNLESKIYRKLNEILTNEKNIEEINSNYPDKSIERRNTGYALDLLLNAETFSGSDEKINLCKLIAGSEGTLLFITEIKLNLVDLPPKEKAVVAVHCNSIEQTFKANLIALKYKPAAIELIDKIILDCTKENIEQRKNRFFIQGDPGAILVVEFYSDSKEKILQLKKEMEEEIKTAGLGYHFPVLFGADIGKVWNLRKAGLGLLSNIPGDKKPVAVIEDTAVNPQVLPDYMAEFKEVLKEYNLECVYYAHIATGELHLRPVLNLKDANDVKLFHTIADEIAKLVKKYKGSLSGEHGDGRLRGEFIPFMLGDHIYNLFKEVKNTWDPEHIFNPGKIVDTPEMNKSLRYVPGQKTEKFETQFDYSSSGGFLQAIEKCNGSGDCRKSEIIGGTMCPSYMAAKDEKNTTRARANTLREYLTNGGKEKFSSKEIYEVLDLCLSCKGCKSECPSNVDMARLKAEYMQFYYDQNGISLRTRLIAYLPRINNYLKKFAGLNNFFLGGTITSALIKKVLGFAPERNIPLMHKFTFRYWIKQNFNNLKKNKKRVYIFADEFTNFNDVETGIKTVKLLNKLGYRVEVPEHFESGRTFLSKGLVKEAKKIANKNVNLLHRKISEKNPLLGVEPSAILTFRDEYPDLVNSELREEAKTLAKNCLMIDEFIAKEIDEGNITSDNFVEDKINIKLHGHCHQKALASTVPTKKMLTLPKNYSVEEIPSGCCGMAGSFGYEKEHYELSTKIGELVLFPAVREAKPETIISAPGTSCRHQIKDGTGREVYHPAEILYNALK